MNTGQLTTVLRPVRFLIRLVRSNLRRLVFWTLLLALSLLVGLWVFVSSPRAVTWTIEAGLPRLNQAIPGELQIGGWEGTFGDWLRLDDVVVHDDEGREVVKVARIEVQLQIWDLLVGDLNVDRVLLVEPSVLLETREDGRLGIAAAFVAPGGGGKKRGRRQSYNSLFDIDVKEVRASRGQLTWEDPTGVRLRLDPLDLEATWSWEGDAQDLSLRSLSATPLLPRALEPIRVKGGAQLAGLELSVDQLAFDWRQCHLEASGPLGFITSLEPDVAIDARLEWAELKDLLPSLPLAGGLESSLRLSGRPSRVLELSGDVRTSDGGTILVEAASLELKPEDGRAPKHSLNLRFDELAPRDLLVGIEPLPDRLDGSLTWTGRGFTLDELEGRYRLDSGAFEIRRVPVRGLEASGEVQASVLGIREGVLKFAQGHIDLSGTTDPRARSFFFEVDATVDDLGDFREASYDWLRGGEAVFDGFVRGSWGGANRFAVSSEGSLDLTRSRIGPTRQAQASGEWTLDMVLPLREAPSLEGSVGLEALGFDVGGGRQLRRVRFDSKLRGRDGTYSLAASRGSDLLLTTSGVADWSRSPTIRFKGRKLEMLAGDEHVQSEGVFDVKVRSGTVQLNNLELKSESGRFFAQGSFNPATQELALNLRLRGLELSEVPALARAVSDRPWPWLEPRGTLDEIFVKASGSLSEPQLSFRASASGIALGDRPHFGIRAELESADGLLKGSVSSSELVELSLRSLPLAVRLDRLRAPVELAPEGAWDVELDLPAQDLLRFAGLLGRPLPEGIAAGSLTGGMVWKGTTAEPDIRSIASVTGVEMAGRNVNAQFGWTVSDGLLALSASRLKTASEGTILHVEGTAQAPLGDYMVGLMGPLDERSGELPAYLDDMQIRAVLDKVDMSLVHIFAPGLEPMTGVVRGDVNLRGEVNTPEMSSQIQVLGARIGGRELHPIEFTAELVEDRLSSDFRLRPRKGGALVGRGEVTFPLRLQPLSRRDELLGSEDLRAEFDGEGFPISILLAFVPGLTEEEGSLTLRGGVTGSLLRPLPDIRMTVEEGKACARKAGLCYENVRLASVIRDSRLDLEELWVETVPQVVNPIDIARGRVRPDLSSAIAARGSVSLEGYRPRDVELQVELPRAWLMYTNEIQVQVDGELGVRGQFPQLEVLGELDVQNVEIDLGQEDIGREIQDLQLPPNLTVHRVKSKPGPGERVGGSEEGSTSLQLLEELKSQARGRVMLHMTNNVNVNLSVGIAGRSDAALAANLLGSIEPRLILGGDVELLWEDGQLGGVGEIRTEKGSKLTVLTRQFVVEEGSSMEFVGAIPDTQLSLRALQRSGYGDVAVVISDRLGSPRIDFESAEFEDQADMMSVLLTGKPLSELSAAEGGGALGQITEALAGFGTKAFGKYVPVDRLAVDIGDDISSGSVEAGKALSPWLFFLTRFRWGAEEDENRVEGQLELRFDRRGYVEVRMGDRLIGSADVVWKIHF